MTPTRQGSFHLFRFSGIDVYLHWSWFVVAVYSISSRSDHYSWWGWNVYEYLALFAIVLMHEFGHSLACRQVGGQADQIVLWPLGGVAYVNPPPRPGPTLWSIAAGPLVNVVLAPLLTLLASQTGSLHFDGTRLTDFQTFVRDIWVVNLVLLGFNLLPIYPLDGGQILRSILWFFVGRSLSLLISAVLGLVVVATLMILYVRTLWLGILGVFILITCWKGLGHARALSQLDKAPKHTDISCPACGISPPKGPFWRCGKCEANFDTFDTKAICPRCGLHFPQTGCFHCGRQFPINEWLRENETRTV